jgi:cytochrome c
MWRLSLAGAVLVAGVALAQGVRYQVGRPATDADVNERDISVLADGRGLPTGSGTAAAGRDVYARRCQKCHGNQGQGGEEGPALVGGKGSLATAKPVKTVGSFWPHATTLFDYTRRAMPFNRPGTLSIDEVYASVAYMLFMNGIVGENDRIDAKSLPAVKMPNRDGFVRDDRPDTDARGAARKPRK